MEYNVKQFVIANLMRRFAEKILGAPDPETSPIENMHWWEENIEKVNHFVTEYSDKIVDYLKEQGSWM